MLADIRIINYPDNKLSGYIRIINYPFNYPSTWRLNLFKYFLCSFQQFYAILQKFCTLTLLQWNHLTGNDAILVSGYLSGKFTIRQTDIRIVNYPFWASLFITPLHYQYCCIWYTYQRCLSYLVVIWPAHSLPND